MLSIEAPIKNYNSSHFTVNLRICQQFTPSISQYAHISHSHLAAYGTFVTDMHVNLFTQMHSFSASKICFWLGKNSISSTDAPTVTIYPPQSPYTVSVGTTLFLYCRADGVPAPTVQWYSGTKAVVYYAQVYQQSYLVQTDLPGTRIYTCEGNNTAGTMKQSVRKSIIVIVEGTVQVIRL